MKDEQLLRYSRHILLDEIGIEAQERLLASTMLVVGAGGLGSPAALYLAAAGVGRLMLADGDTVDLTNLQRQILHYQDRVGMEKTASAQLTLKALNPEVEVLALPRLPADTTDTAACPTSDDDGTGTRADTTAGTLPPSTLSAAIAQADVVLDCSDNFPTRQAINHYCVEHRKPLVSGAAIRFDGQVAVFDPRKPASPCYHCLFPEGENLEETRCSQMGVFAPLTGIVGTMQAAEALKLAGQFGTPMSGRLILIDARTLRFTDIRVPRDPGCPVCKTRH
ncbi:MAG: ThiF family adenylyltransferase [Lautropia sp.]|nr:ThiF family adenylyltransferase [Lautropia sp.]